jgi:hypothetical protein
MEQSILVCDVCGVPATATVTVRVEGKSLQKDLCADHLGELVHGARPARPGRRRSPGPTPARRRSTTTAKRRTAKKSTKKSTAASKPRRGRRPRAAAVPAEGAPEPGAE